jgi:hypothetical protein
LKKRRSPHRTQWAAQFAVASELYKRDCQVALTLGNHPMVDLMVISPRGRSFRVDVKGAYKPNFWVVHAQPSQEDLYYVFAFVPDGEPNRFFILTQNQVNEQIPKEKEATARRASEKGRSIEKAGLFRVCLGSSCNPTKMRGARSRIWYKMPQPL